MDWEAWVGRLEGVTLPPVAAHPLPHGWSPRLTGGRVSIGPVEGGRGMSGDLVIMDELRLDWDLPNG